MNPTPCVPGLRAISSPTSAPGPVTRLNTPGGRSASATHSASATAATAVVEAGVQTTVFPAASAGAIELGGHRVRPVPRRDHADHPARSADEQHALARRERVREPSLEPLAVLGGVAPVRDELLDLVARLVQRLALVERERVDELLAPVLDLVGDAVHRRRALERRRARPAGRGVVRRRDRATGVVAAALRHLGDRLARRGRVRRERLTARGARPGAGDEHLRRHVGSRPRARCASGRESRRCRPASRRRARAGA